MKPGVPRGIYGWPVLLSIAAWLVIIWLVGTIVGLRT